MFYNAGTGIALGIIAGGRLYRGASNTAGENGHAVIDHSACWPCPCGMTGCLETMIVAGRRGATLPRLAGLSVMPATEDPAYAYLASSLLDAIDIFDPAAVVLGGGMLTSSSLAMSWLSDLLTRAATDACIVPAFAGADAGLVGASALLAQANDSSHF